MELESIEKYYVKFDQEYKKEIENLEQKNEGLKFNYEYLESNNIELEREIIQSEEKHRKKISMREVWEQIYRNLLFFLSNNQDEAVTK